MWFLADFEEMNAHTTNRVRRIEPGNFAGVLITSDRFDDDRGDCNGFTARVRSDGRKGHALQRRSFHDGRMMRMNLTRLEEADSDRRAMPGLGISSVHEAECSSSDRAISHDRNSDAEPVHPSHAASCSQPSPLFPRTGHPFDSPLISR